MSLHAALDVSHTPNGRPIPSLPVVAEWLRSTGGVLRKFYFHWHRLLWVLQLAVFEQLKVGGEGRNRTGFDASVTPAHLIQTPAFTGPSSDRQRNRLQNGRFL